MGIDRKSSVEVAVAKQRLSRLERFPLFAKQNRMRVTKRMLANPRKPQPIASRIQ
jgi:hypothetical protein